MNSPRGKTRTGGFKSERIPYSETLGRDKNKYERGNCESKL